MVFETDEPHPEDHEEKGTFGDVFDKLFKAAGDNHDPPLGIETAMKFVVEPKGGKVPTVDELKDVHAILITGSMYDAHGDDEWILKLIKLLQGTIRYCALPSRQMLTAIDLWQHRPDIRFSGVCFGHQILCRMLGAKVDTVPGGKERKAKTTPNAPGPRCGAAKFKDYGSAQRWSESPHLGKLGTHGCSRNIHQRPPFHITRPLRL